MRWACSLCVLALAACAPDAPAVDTGSRAQFDRLEHALLALSEAPETEWLDRLESVKGLALEDPGVVSLRDLCVSAYEAFGEATVRLGAARAQVAGVESALREGPEGDAGLADLARLRDGAVRSTREVSATLDRAEKLVARCVQERRSLREKLASRPR
jgi:hypothetical protein